MSHAFCDAAELILQLIYMCISTVRIQLCQKKNPQRERFTESARFVTAMVGHLKGCMLLATAVAWAPLGAAALAARPTPATSLRKALSRGRQLIVELTPDDPAAAPVFELDELSARLRDAGAAAVVVPPTLVAPILAEQATAAGDYPGPLPVLCALEGLDCDGGGVATLRERGAAGVAVRVGADDADDLATLAAHTADAGLALLVLAADASGVSAAAAVAATVVVRAFADEGAADAEGSGVDAGASGTSLPVPLGAWDGSDEALARLRSDGVSAAMLLDG
jgi:hypothetical protein